mgnify:FL=1
MFDKRLFALPGSKSAIAWCIATSLLLATLMVGQAAALAWALTLLWEGSALSGVAAQLGAFALCFMGKQAASNIQAKQLELFAAARTEEFRQELSKRLYEGGAPLTQKLGTGAASTLCLDGIDNIEHYLSTALPRTVALVTVPFVLLAVIVFQDWVSALIALLVFPAIILQMVLIGSTAQEEAGKQHREYQRLANHFIDSLRGIDTLKYFGRSNEQADRVYETSEKFRIATMKTLRTATLSGAVLDAFSTISLAAVAVMLGFRLVDGSIALLPALFVLVIMPDYFRPIREFASDYHATLNGKNTLTQVLEVLGCSAETVAKKESRTPGLQVDAPKLEPWQKLSVLTFKHIGISYEGETALKDVSCSFGGFRKYGIVGPSGCGKTTLAQLLAGVLQPTQGSIVVNNHAIETLSMPSWRKQVAYLPQSPHIFSTTLRNNLTFYQPDATEEEISHALELVGLTSLVTELPKGLDTVVGEGGRSLSGGQSQRVALARAMLHRTCRVLVFDEPTAHLDIETEWELKQRMLPLMEGKLVFFATHRLHWLSEMDEILLLEDGQVRDFGSYEALSKASSFAYLSSNEKEGGNV